MTLFVRGKQQRRRIIPPAVCAQKEALPSKFPPHGCFALRDYFCRSVEDTM